MAPIYINDVKIIYTSIFVFVFVWFSIKFVSVFLASIIKNPFRIVLLFVGLLFFFVILSWLLLFWFSVFFWFFLSLNYLRRKYFSNFFFSSIGFACPKGFDFLTFGSSALTSSDSSYFFGSF